MAGVFRCLPERGISGFGRLLILKRCSIPLSQRQCLPFTNGETFYVMPQDAWRNLTCLESGSVIYIQKNGKFAPVTDTLHLDR